MTPISTMLAVDCEDLARCPVGDVVAAVAEGAPTARQAVAAVWTWRRAASPDADPQQILNALMASPWPHVLEEALALGRQDDDVRSDGPDGPVDLTAARQRLDEVLAAAKAS